MHSIKNLNDMIVFLQKRGDKKRVAVVCANDASTRYAVEKAQEMGFVEPVYIDGEDKNECARRAVALCKSGEADILMKGLINTDVILKAILDRETGILRPGHVLTHIAMAEIPKYEKLLFFTDAAVIPVPTEAQRRQQIHYVNPASLLFIVRKKSAPKSFLIPLIIWRSSLRLRQVSSAVASSTVP